MSRYEARRGHVEPQDWEECWEALTALIDQIQQSRGQASVLRQEIRQLRAEIGAAIEQAQASRGSAPPRHVGANVYRLDPGRDRRSR